MYIAQIELKNGQCMEVQMDAVQCADHVKLTLSKDKVPADFAAVRILPGYFDAKVGDEGYYVATQSHTGTFLSYFKAREEDQELRWSADYLSFTGKVDGEKAQLLIVDGMRNAVEFRINTKGDAYSLIAEVRTEYSQDFYEDLTVELYELTGKDANYSGMARCYRTHELAVGNCRPLKDKAAERPILKELAHSPEIRIRMGWKPAPSPVEEQTLENEPPMHVACTFAHVEELVAELKKQGIENAELCLVGWNIKGHDGRWPQVFPVDPEIGGEEALRHLIQVTKDAGYKMVCHTNSTDAYHISEDFCDEILLVDGKGTHPSAGAWSGGNGYQLCPIKAEELAHRDLPRVRELGYEGSHYIDVISTVTTRQCVHPDHPMNHGECAEIWNRILKYSQDMFGAISSEGTFGFTAGVLDYGLYSAFNLLGKAAALADERVPVWSMVYHGIMLYNPSAETINYPVKGRANRVKFMEYGGRPAIYYYSNFHETSHWMGTSDFLMDTREQLEDTAAKIAGMMKDYAPVEDLQYAFMDCHEKVAEGVYRVTYSDGSRVLCNYNTEAAECDGVTIPAEDYVIVHA